MTITYPVHNGLYVNLTNRCPCACAFCIRNNGQGAYGSDSLWLDREPTADEVIEAIVRELEREVKRKGGGGQTRWRKEVEVDNGGINNSSVHLISPPPPSSYSELVFCGYGEPTERLDVLLEVAKRVKTKWPELKIRVNTNGLSDLINGEPTAAKFAGVIDVVSISLNAPTAEEYFALCRPKFGLPAYDAMLDFARAVKDFVPSVMMTVVATKDFTDEKCAACEAICEKIGVPLRVRTFVAG